MEDADDTHEDTPASGLSAAVVEAGMVTEYEAPVHFISSETPPDRIVRTATGYQEPGSSLVPENGVSRTESNAEDAYARDPEDDLPGAICPTVKICTIS